MAGLPDATGWPPTSVITRSTSPAWSFDSRLPVVRAPPSRTLPVSFDATGTSSIVTVWDTPSLKARSLPSAVSPDVAPSKDSPWTVKRSEEHTSELQSLMRISYAVFCLKKNTQHTKHYHLLTQST